MTEDEMAEWHHQLNGHGFEWTPGVVDGQGGLTCCNLWGCKESDTTERLYNKRVVIIYGGKDKYQVPIPSGRMKGNEKGNNSLTR